jgi:hypothetical protein
MSFEWRNGTGWPRIGTGGMSLDLRVALPWLLCIWVPIIFYVAIFVTAIFLFAHWKKIKVNHLGRYIVRKLNGKKRRGNAMWRNRSIFSVLVMVLACAGSLAPSDASAEFVLVPPSKSAKPAMPLSKVNEITLPDISHHMRHQLIANQAKLHDVLNGVIPVGWVVRYFNPEIEYLRVDLRAKNMSTLSIFEDLSMRYGIYFKYGETSGVVYVHWKENDNCKPHYNEATKQYVVC